MVIMKKYTSFVAYRQHPTTYRTWKSILNPQVVFSSAVLIWKLDKVQARKALLQSRWTIAITSLNKRWPLGKWSHFQEPSFSLIIVESFAHTSLTYLRNTSPILRTGSAIPLCLSLLGNAQMLIEPHAMHKNALAAQCSPYQWHHNLLRGLHGCMAWASRMYFCPCSQGRHKKWCVNQ